MTGYQGYFLGDEVYSQMYAGMKQEYEWTKQQLALIDYEELLGILLGYTPNTRKWFVSRALESAIDEIEEIVANPGSALKRIKIDSNHDEQIANIMVQLKPDFVMDVIPYSTTFDFKVFQEDGRFFIKTEYNNIPQLLTSCDGQLLCPYEKWHNHISQHLILSKTHLKSFCDQKVDANSLQYGVRTIPY